MPNQVFARTPSLMRGLQRVTLSWIVLLVACMANHGESATPQEPRVSSVPWDQVRQLAEDFVAKESPKGIFPFTTADHQQQYSDKKVFIHYFPVWLLSLDNQPLGSDFWTENYNNPMGREGLFALSGRYAANGGFFRERPITPPPWSSPFWLQRNFAVDVLRAARIGADGFLLDLPQINTGTIWDTEIMLCQVAAHVAPGFSIVLEPGMASLRNQRVNPQDLGRALVSLNSCPAVRHLADGRLLVAPFATDFEPPAFWKEVMLYTQAHGVPMALLPVLLNARKYADAFKDISYGMSMWGAGDIEDVTGPQGLALTKLLRSLSPVWMDPTRAQDVRPKNPMFWEADNIELYRAMWITAIRTGANYVQPITWNDFSEGTEIEPASATQFLFYDLTAFYTEWYKSGEQPKINFDAIYYASRDQIITPGQTYPSEKVPMKMLGATPVHNNIEMVAFLTRPSVLEIRIGHKTYRESRPAGMARFVVAAAYGRPSFRILSHGKTVCQVTAHYVISAHPTRENPLYFGGSSQRPVWVADTGDRFNVPEY